MSHQLEEVWTLSVSRSTTDFPQILWKSPSSGLNHHIWQKLTSADSKTHIQDMNIHHVTHAAFLSLWCVWLPAPGRHSRAAVEILPGFTVRPKQEIIFTSRETFQYKGVLFFLFFFFLFFLSCFSKKSWLNAGFQWRKQTIPLTHPKLNQTKKIIPKSRRKAHFPCFSPQIWTGMPWHQVIFYFSKHYFSLSPPFISHLKFQLESKNLFSQ